MKNQSQNLGRVSARHVLGEALRDVARTLRESHFTFGPREEFHAWKALDSMLESEAPEFLLRTRSFDPVTGNFKVELLSEPHQQVDALRGALQRWALLTNVDIHATINHLSIDQATPITPEVIHFRRIPLDIVLPTTVASRWGVSTGADAVQATSTVARAITEALGNQALRHTQILPTTYEARIRSVVAKTRELEAPQIVFTAGRAELTIGNGVDSLRAPWFYSFVKQIADIGEGPEAPRCVITFNPSTDQIEAHIASVLPNDIAWDTTFNHQLGTVRIDLEASTTTSAELLSTTIERATGYRADINTFPFSDRSKIIAELRPSPAVEFSRSDIEVSAANISKVLSPRGADIEVRGNRIYATLPSREVPSYYVHSFKQLMGVAPSVGVRLLAPTQNDPVSISRAPEILSHWLSCVIDPPPSVVREGNTLVVKYNLSEPLERGRHAEKAREAFTLIQGQFPGLSVTTERVIDPASIYKAVHRELSNRNSFIPYRVVYDEGSRSVDFYVDNYPDIEAERLAVQLGVSVNVHPMQGHFPVGQVTVLHTPATLGPSPLMLSEVALAQQLHNRVPHDLLIHDITVYGNVAIVVHGRENIPTRYEKLLKNALSDIPIQIYLTKSSSRHEPSPMTDDITFAIRSAPAALLITSANTRSEAIRFHSVGNHTDEQSREITRWQSDMYSSLSRRVEVEYNGTPSQELCNALTSESFNIQKYRTEHFPEPPKQQPSTQMRQRLLQGRSIVTGVDCIALDGGGTRFRETAFSAELDSPESLRVGIHVIDPEYLVDPESAAADFYHKHPFPISKKEGSLQVVSELKHNGENAGLKVGVLRPTITIWLTINPRTGERCDEALELTAVSLARTVDFDRSNSVSDECENPTSPLGCMINALPAIRDWRLADGNISIARGKTVAESLVYEMTVLANNVYAEILNRNQIPFIYLASRAPRESYLKTLIPLLLNENISTVTHPSNDDEYRALIASALAALPDDKVHTLSRFSRGRDVVFRSTPMVDWTSNTYCGHFGTPGRSAVAYLNLLQAKAFCDQSAGREARFCSHALLTQVAETANRARYSRRQSNADLSFLDEIEKSKSLAGTPQHAELLKIIGDDAYVWLPERKIAAVLDCRNTSFDATGVIFHDTNSPLRRININQRFKVTISRLSLENGLPIATVHRR